MTEHLKLAFSDDIEVRTHGLEHLDPEGLRVNVHEISAGPAYHDAHNRASKHNVEKLRSKRSRLPPRVR